MGRDAEVDRAEIAKFDRRFTKQFYRFMSPVIRRYFRSEVHGWELFPVQGGVMIVSNHSGGNLTPDVLVLAPSFYQRFGYCRPLYTLAHYGVFLTPLRDYLFRLGVVHASRANAEEMLRSGAVVLAFPGGDYDSYRSTFEQNVIDFEGRTGYVTTAVEAEAPIVPAVSIGAQETQLFLTGNS